jgi:proteasome lid subunit RPN8/RPN11
MTREVCFIISKSDAILWADASDSPTALPDSRARWEAIWRYRDELAIIAHSHPIGPAAFSAEDLSTMAALDAALATPPTFMVVAPRVTIVRDGDTTLDVVPEPWWAALMRLASGMTKEGN